MNVLVKFETNLKNTHRSYKIFDPLTNKTDEFHFLLISQFHYVSALTSINFFVARKRDIHIMVYLKVYL